MTLSPTETSSGTRLPLSSMRPGPIARTSPSWGFSLAVSGMTRPEAVVCSASSGFTTMRSSRGLMLTDTMSTSTFWALVRVRTDGTIRGAEEGSRTFEPARRYAVAGVVRRRKRWHSRVESANADVSTPPGRVPGWSRSRDCQTAWRGPRRLPLAADRRRTGRAGPGRRGDRRPRARRARDPGPAPALALGGTRGRRPHAGRAAPPGGAEVRGPGRPPVLHARRPRAGHPDEGGYASGGPAPGRGHPLSRRPGLRDRRR